MEFVETAVIGGGPAGLTAAYTLAKNGRDVIVFEKDPVYVGGISRTVNYNGFLFDIGGHRFFSKSKEIVDLWNEILPDDFIDRPRLSRIFYNNKFYGYPLKAFEALFNLGLAAFVTTAVAVRFVYPMVSLEGRSWWILRSAPVSLAAIWRSKFWIGFAPLLAFGEGLVVVTNRFLGVAAAPTAVFAATLAPLIAAVVSLGLAFGAAYPRLETQNAAQIATGFGAIVYMVTALGLIAVVVLLEAWPIARLFWATNAQRPLTGVETGLVLAAFAAALAAIGATFAASRRTGLRKLAELAA